MISFESYKSYLISELKIYCKGISKREIAEFLYYTQKAFDSEYEIAINAGADHFGAREFAQEVMEGRLRSKIEDWVVPVRKVYPVGEQLNLNFYLDCSQEIKYNEND